MAECFGCRHLKFKDMTTDMDFGYWICRKDYPKPPDIPNPCRIPVVGKVGLWPGQDELICEPPKQVCNGEWEYYL